MGVADPGNGEPSPKHSDYVMTIKQIFVDF